MGLTINLNVVEQRLASQCSYEYNFGKLIFSILSQSDQQTILNDLNYSQDVFLFKFNGEEMKRVVAPINFYF